MLKVGVTGGIGSGKSVVCQVFATLGIPVFNADDTARYLMENDASLVNSITRLFGPDVYEQGKLNRGKVSDVIFREPAKLQQLNALVHPATKHYSNQWFLQHTTVYAIKEAALFFESGTYKDIDVMIGVSAPVEIRIQRVIKRSSITHEKVSNIILAQMDEGEKMKRCNYIIYNDDVRPILPQVLSLHETLMAMGK
jgi:dephospho-CoA kinase